MPLLRKSILVSTALLILALAGLIWFQSFSLKQLKHENEALRAETENIRALPSEMAEPQVSSTTNQDDLLRLRGEVARLHRSLAEARATIESLTNSPAETSDSPVENYLINVQTNLTWGETLVVGGWKMANDARGIIFIQAMHRPEFSSFSLRAQLFSVSDQMLSKLQLDVLKVDSKRSSNHVVLSPDEADRISGVLRIAGLKPLAVGALGPAKLYDNITFKRRDDWGGKQYSLFLHPEPDPLSMANGFFSDPLRPVLIVTPSVSPDRQSIQLTVSALINYPLNFMSR